MTDATATHAARTLCAAMATRMRPPRRDRRWLAVYRGPWASPTARTVRAAETLPGSRARLAYAASVARAAVGARTATRPTPDRAAHR